MSTNLMFWIKKPHLFIFCLFVCCHDRSSKSKTIRNEEMVCVERFSNTFTSFFFVRSEYFLHLRWCCCLQSYFGHFTCTLKGFVTTDEAISMDKDTPGDSRQCGKRFISNTSPLLQQTQPENIKNDILVLFMYNSVINNTSDEQLLK